MLFLRVVESVKNVKKICQDLRDLDNMCDGRVIPASVGNFQNANVGNLRSRPKDDFLVLGLVT
jgi:hypothetical protein